MKMKDFNLLVFIVTLFILNLFTVQQVIFFHFIVGDTLQLAMQEIDNDVSLLEPVSYEVKLAAMTAMIPKNVAAGMTFDCPICSSVHSRLYDLKCHLSRHFGLSLYLCSYCGRQFTNSSNLIRHVRIHSGDKPYRCKDCGKRYLKTNENIIIKNTSSDDFYFYFTSLKI